MPAGSPIVSAIGRAAAASRPDIDIGVAAQVAQIPPRDRVEALADQRFGYLLAGGRAAAGRFAADHDDADAVLLDDRLRGLPDPQLADQVAQFGRDRAGPQLPFARQLRRLLLADPAHIGAAFRGRAHALR